MNALNTAESNSIGVAGATDNAAAEDAQPRTSSSSGTVLGRWRDGQLIPLDAAHTAQLRQHLHDPACALAIVEQNGQLALGSAGRAELGVTPTGNDAALLAFAPALTPHQLGDASFRADHRLRYAYMTGSMANGIASAEIVEAMAPAGMLGSYGAAGQSLTRVGEVIDRLQRSLGDQPTCFNLIHSPNEPAHEMALVELYLQRGVKLVEASAYLDLTPAVVRYRVKGITRRPNGSVHCPHRIIAKASRIEVATRWFSPPPQKMLHELVVAGHLTAEEAELARHIPMAQDLTAEADSGGHTDNRPAITLIPTFLALRDRLSAQHRYAMPLRVGAAGGIATPASAAAALAMGAAYLVTGSVNQACVEAGSCDAVRKMLAEVEQTDVTMAPAADMFELGVKLQVIKRGTMFPMRAAKLYELYRNYRSIEDLPAGERATIEKTIFRRSLDEVWADTRAFFLQREPGQVQRAERDPHHRMALVFRWYLGLSSRWANAGEPTRQLDYQVWAGPAMGAFNEWTRDSFLAAPAARNVRTVAWNILHGAAVATRLNLLACQGVTLPAELTRITPRPDGDLQEALA